MSLCTQVLLRITAGVAGIVAAGWAATADAEEDVSGVDTNGPAVAIDEASKTIARERHAKPAVFKSWGERLDFIENNFTYGLQTGVSRVDAFFGSDELHEWEERPTSSLRLGTYIELEEDSGLTIRIDPDYDVSVKLPNLEKNWKVFITGRQVGEAPDTAPTERERGVQVGIRRALEKYYLYLDAGLKVTWPPELFVQGKWSPHWSVKNWRFHPGQEFFWDTDEGFGELTSYHLFRWLGKRQRYVFALTGSAKWSEETIGVECRQSVKLGRVIELIEEQSRGRNVETRELARGVGLRYTISGHIDSEKIVDAHRLTLGFRRPLYRRWLYLEIAPELKWRNASDWRTIPSIRFGIEALFWGFGQG